ncbi:MAG: BatA and WFA domain-containing protein [Planctomycetia bacterium]|nr:BatA and WFA domain-containing protein [Planctomycetia bacterium]
MHIAFLSPWVLLGTLLVAVPIIIHLVMRKKPKLLQFPALELLQNKRKTNLRKLRLRHWLLLALRMALVLLAALALARPLATNLPGALAVGNPLGVVIVFDTSASMDYKIEGKSRLDQAREQALSYVQSLPGGSEVAIFDTADSTTGRFVTPGEAVKLIENRKIAVRNRPVTAAMEDALRLLERSAPNLPLLLCVFSDRSNASWDANVVGTTLLPLKQGIEAKLNRTLNVVYNDLGATEPRNLCITGLAVRPSSVSTATNMEDLRFGVPARELLNIVATIQTTNLAVNNEVSLYLDNKPEPVSKKNITFTGGENKLETKAVTFDPIEVKDNLVQGRVVLSSPDALDADNTRYFTLIAPTRRVLILADDPSQAYDWKLALESLRILPMTSDIKKPTECPAGLSPDDYQAVCLFSVANPSQQLWEILQRYVQVGGGLVIVPGPGLNQKAYNTPLALELMPGKPGELKTLPPPGASLEVGNYDHPALSNFKRWQRDISPFKVTRYWDLETVAGVTNVIAPLQEATLPTLWAERIFDRNKVAGRVVWLGTAMYSLLNDPNWKDWNNFQAGWLYVGLAHTCVSHVIGAREQLCNFKLGEEVRFLLPRNSKVQEYVLKGPVSGSGKIQPGMQALTLPEANRPGNYLVSDPTGGLWSRSFSVNMQPAETQLVQNRPASEELERFFGKDGVAALGEEKDLSTLVKDALGLSPQSELLPYLMLLLLLLLAGENYLANRFYQPEQVSP